MKKLLLPLVLPIVAFVVTLTLVAAYRLSSAGTILIAGALAGALASVPTSMALAWVLVHRPPRRVTFTRSRPPGYKTPVPTPTATPQPAPPSAPPTPAARPAPSAARVEPTIIGGAPDPFE